MSATTQKQMLQDVNTSMDSDLPEGWEPTNVGEILSVNYGKGLKEANRKPGKVPVFGSNGEVGKNNVPLTHGPTIIIGRKGTIGAVHFSECPCWPIDTTYYIDEFHGLDPTYVTFALRGLNLGEFDTSTAIPGLNRDDFYNQTMLLAPLAEQKRIVAKIEELLAQVNAARARLAKVAQILKRFRQAVLAAACSGRLTEDWRRDHPNGESASALLKRLQKQHPSWLNSNNSYEEDLPELPNSWAWATASQVGEITTGNTPSKKREEYFGGPIPFFKPTDLDAGYYVDKSTDSLTAKGAELARVLPPLTVMVTCIGATIGKTGLSRRKGATNQQVNSVTADQKFVSPHWLYFTFTSPWMQEQIKVRASETTLPILNKRRFERLPLPVPPSDEQREIVRRVEGFFKFADAVEKRVEAATKRTEKLTQAILAKASRGELVPTEAELARREGRDYEPASVLLERIRAARQAKEVTASVNGRPRARKKTRK